VFADPLTATEAFQQLPGGPYRVEFRNLLWYAEGERMGANFAAERTIDHRALVSVDRDGTTRFMGVAGPEYELLGPDAVVEVWDQATGAKIETIGALGNGERLFISTRLPDYSVKGEEVNDFLIANASFSGHEANWTLNSPVCPVCQNTLIAAMRMASARMRVVHLKDVRAAMWTSLHEAYEQGVARARLLKDAFEILANYRVPMPTAEEALRQVYTAPPMPVTVKDPEVQRVRSEAWESRVERVAVRRDAAMSLYAGRGRGMDLTSRKGTGWGLYNAVVELEDYRNVRGDGREAAESSLFGERAAVKARAFEVLHGAATGTVSLN